MSPIDERLIQARRQFFASSACGLGGTALASMLFQDGLLGGRAEAAAITGKDVAAGANPLAPRQSHFPGRAKACIFIFLEGGPSQIDLFDPKPKLKELNGQAPPADMLKNVRFAFIKKETATLLGSPRRFTPSGECGMELSDRVPHLQTVADDICLVRSMHTDQFNHHPAQLLLCTGRPVYGSPSVGSWLTYGLGSPSKNLPGYVVLTAGRGGSGGASLWSNGFLPSSYGGVLFRNQGEPVLNLNNPPGLTSASRRQVLDAMGDLNRARYAALGDTEIASRISSYELAFRMQSAAPELIDLSGETKETLDMYGVGRTDGDMEGVQRIGGPGQYNAFSVNCLLARRLVQRGVRFVNLVHASWDHHGALEKSLKFNCGMADQPVAALIKDLKRHGLLDDTLVIFAGEFGRTPLLDNAKGNDGRDHHPYAFSLWMAGGGTAAGRVVGKTDELGWAPVEDPIHINDFHATLLHLFGFDHNKLSVRFKGLDAKLTDVGESHVVQKLLA
ncbi:MAG: DUF1501 domain-containing protein [Planctomycetaceae bacterium]